MKAINKKVLLINTPAGGGHVKAAKAIEEAFKLYYPEIVIKNVDILDFASDLYRKIVKDGYDFICKNQPEVWGWLYQHYNEKSKQKFLTRLSQLAIEKKFIPFVKEFNPDFIIATHPLPAVVISQSKQQDIIDIKSSLVVTDFGCHSFWIDKEVNYYFVATDKVKKCLEDYRIDPSKIVVTGIPIELKFLTACKKSEILKKLGLKSDIFTVLVIGGQFTFSDLQKVINGAKNNHQGKIQFIVVSGRDHKLAEEIAESDLSKSQGVKAFGFVENMEELMSAADLIFTKAGGLTVSECLAKCLPMIINKVIPGQEEDNVNYLFSNGAAVKADGTDQIIEEIGKLLAAPAKLAAMKKNCKNLAKPRAAKSLVDFVYKIISEK